MSTHTEPNHLHRYSVLAARPHPRCRADYRFTAQALRDDAEDVAVFFSKLGFRAVLMRDDGVVETVLAPEVPRVPR